MIRRCLCIVAALALVAVAVPAIADDVIEHGVDGWKTVSSTYSSFAEQPIPAGFFCADSPAFTGRIALRGVPLATEPALQGQDTLIERLDDAVFDAEGVARTRIALLALNLESTEPVDTGCGLYDARVVLDDEQPTTEMTIVRDADNGGTFEAPLAINTRVIFTPVKGGESLEMARRIDLGPGSNSVWIEGPYAGPEMVRIDTDGDGVTDREVPLRSNFHAGVAPAATSGTTATEVERTTTTCRSVTSCHCTIGSTNPNEPNTYCEHLHCIQTVCPIATTPVESQL